MSHKPENMKFLEWSYTGKKGLTDFDGLCNWYFGSEKRTISVCAHRAYRDFCRRLTGISKCKATVKDSWRKQSEDLIVTSIEELFQSLPNGLADFDRWHKNVCEKLIEHTPHVDLKLPNEFPYGLAQKWLNMTLKNMLIMEQWNTQLDTIKDYLHVPVDSYIMEAASKCQVAIQRKDGQYDIYREDVSKPWSQWDYEVYIEFQKELRKKLSEAPIVWEGPAWIEIAKTRNK